MYFFIYKLVIRGLFQNLLANWIRVNILPSKNRALLSQIIVKMVRSRVWKTLSTWQFSNNVSLFLPENLGDSAHSERQVSPGKLYRAALLKNRFADTILKAREKTLSQVGYIFGVIV